MTPDDLLARIRVGIDTLITRDPELRVFGSGSHRYRFRPPISEVELAALETAGGYRLPDDYRAFVTTIGNGGAGPSYGVMPFHGRDSEDYTRYDQLGTPFAYVEPWNPSWLLGGADEDEDEDHDDPQMDSQHQYWAAFSTTGFLHVCHHGCASRSMLVVTGACRGEIWEDETANDAGYFPARVTPDAPRHTFGSWYLAWLDRALAGER